MTPALPAEAAALHAQLVAAHGEAGVLCLLLSKDYRVRGWRGEPTRFGLGDLVPGVDVRAAAPYLDHFEDAGRLTLPFVNIGEDRAVHLHVLADGGADAVSNRGWSVLFADADAELVRERDQQQRENEARARTQRLQGRLVQATAEGALWRDRAERAQADGWRLAGVLSHELRTPLSAIAGYARLLEQALHDRQDLRGQAAVISRSAAQIAHLVEATLAQYRREGNEIGLRPQPTDVRGLVGQLTELLAPLAADKALGFAAFVSPALPARLHLDGMRLRQVLLNLLGNAIKYTPDGWVRLDADWDGPAQMLTVAVTDSGPGIAPAHRERVFVPFERTDEHAPAPGTGLGLPISRRIAERMGGTLALADAPAGTGSRFVLRIPAEPLPADAPGESGAVAPVGITPGRVVVGEDDPDLANLFEIFLERAGFQPTLHTMGRTVCEQVAADAPQVVLLDMHLEDGRDGSRVAERLRASGYNGALIAMSATGEVLREEALAAGCDEFVSKPVSPEDLVALLFDVLERRARREPSPPPAGPAR